jgi:hypothetical protein
MTVSPPPQAVSAVPDNPLSLSSSVRMQITGCPETPALMEAPSKKDISPAEWMHHRLAQAIAAFEKNLDDQHEVAFNLVSAEGGQMLHADNIGYWAPDLIVFMGRNDQGLPIQLFQHVSQVNMLLAAAKKQTPEAPKRIGFEVLKAVEGAAAAEAGHP